MENRMQHQMSSDVIESSGTVGDRGQNILPCILSQLMRRTCTHETDSCCVRRVGGVSRSWVERAATCGGR